MEWRQIPAGQLGNIKTLHDSVGADDIPDGVGSYLVNDEVAESLVELTRQKCKSALGMPDDMIPDPAGVGFCGYASAIVKKFMTLNGRTANIVCVQIGGREHFFVVASRPGSGYYFVVDLTSSQFTNGPQFVATDIYGIYTVAGTAEHGGEHLVDAYKMALGSKGLKQANKEGALW
jgi:hypothetical protein